MRQRLKPAAAPRQRTFFDKRREWVFVTAFLTVLAFTSVHAWAWSHQGHLLMTRLAAMRIINDPAAPPGLRDFLKANVNATLDDCARLATTDTVGAHPEENPRYNQGLDNWATMPDRVKYLPRGKAPIAPYGVSENDMHYVDLERFFSPPTYVDDLSHKPDVEKIPHDLTDRRWRRAGFAAWRVEEMLGRFERAIGAGPTVASPEEALEAAGYLAHYLEDSTQPHHATVDFESVTYLAGYIPQVPAGEASATALAAIHLPPQIDPHGDLEFQLFANANPPRAAFREEYWKDLQADIALLSKGNTAFEPSLASANDAFRWDLRILADSYDYLPLIGRAARAAYANDRFDAPAFFSYTGVAHGQTLSIVQLIALQNAKAVLHVEEAYRLAWAGAHGG